MEDAVKMISEYMLIWSIHGFWPKFDSFGNFEITENTQQSLNMTNINNMTNLTRSSDVGSGRRTALHAQNDSELCYAFAIISALRNALLKFMENQTSIEPEELKAVIEQIEKPDGKFNFKMFIVNYIGNVNPRSFQGLIKSVRIDKTVTEKQQKFVCLEPSV